jgi:hypothetical protein
MTEVEVEGGECRAVNFFITIAPRRDENSLSRPALSPAMHRNPFTGKHWSAFLTPGSRTGPIIGRITNYGSLHAYSSFYCNKSNVYRILC